MKLGSAITDPHTGHRGYVSRFIGEWAICRTGDGQNFRVPVSGTRHRPCEARMPGVFGWLAAVYVKDKKIRIVAADPVWRGAEISLSQVEVRSVKS